MHFEKIPHKMSVGLFAEHFPQSKITLPDKAKYPASAWDSVKDKKFATLHEIMAGGELLYQLVFLQESLSSIQLSINGDFTENYYNDLLSIAHSIKHAQTARGIAAPLTETPILAWKELIESPLPDSGKPDERFIEVCRSTWKGNGCSAYLHYSWTWPGQLCIEYREEAT